MTKKKFIKDAIKHIISTLEEKTEAIQNIANNETLLIHNKVLIGKNWHKLECKLLYTEQKETDTLPQYKGENK